MLKLRRFTAPRFPHRPGVFAFGAVRKIRKIYEDMAEATATKPKRTPRGNEGKGRPKGAKNKFPSDVKAMVQAALHNAGGEAYLTRQAEENPKAFLNLVGKLIPNKIEGDADNPVRVIHTITRRIIGGRHGDGDGDA